MVSRFPVPGAVSRSSIKEPVVEPRRYLKLNNDTAFLELVAYTIDSNSKILLFCCGNGLRKGIYKHPRRSAGFEPCRPGRIASTDFFEAPVLRRNWRHRYEVNLASGPDPPREAEGRET